MRIHLRCFMLIVPIVFLLSALCCLLSTGAEAVVHIDISSPTLKKLPIAIAEFAGPQGKEISDVIKDDLDFTGIFLCLDRNSFIEAPSQSFMTNNWSAIGADAVVKGTVTGGKDLTTLVLLYDVAEGREVFRKEYQTEAALLRPLAHTIANDIYQHMTGEAGIFRTKIAYVERKGREDGLSLIDWDGQRKNDLGIKGNVLLSPHWSKDGSRLIYSAERYRQWGIYLLNFRKMAETKVFSSKGTNIAGDFFPNSDEFIFSSSMGGTPSLYTYIISASRLSRLTSSRGIDVSPSLSPDGSQVCFVSDRGGAPQLFIMSRNGYDARRLTFNGPYNTSPSWSPKGDRIVFSGREGSKNQIFTISPDGSGLMQLTDRGNNEDPSFSPDGRYIVFSSDRDGERSVYVMRSNGEGQKRILPKGTKAFGPRWSPN
ncbi:MAG TPA: Tol-Pal system beta propeller repeat protein TolB [Thermodesulfovibrionales bacterium]|nr:Tol-Pal system beta propeller repeat protein TolB [Thermodesulfovibrionales bacterium]